jgi:twitching motility protein PilU
MQTFDQAALLDAFESNQITEDALRNADSVNDLRLQIKLHPHAAPSPPTRPLFENSRYR